MSHELKQKIISILDAGQDLTLATLREDGYPQATVVSYASDGLDIYVGTAAQSQKARNIARDGRISATITLPYGDWDQIRGVSFGGRAHAVTDPDEQLRMGGLFMRKFPQIAKYVHADLGPGAFFRLEPEVISVLDYSLGFGHTDQVRAAELVLEPV